MSDSLRILVDTNVWVDSYCGWHKGWSDARNLIQAAIRTHAQLLFPVHCTKDVLYIVTQECKRKALKEEGSLDDALAQAAKATALGCLRNMEAIATAVGADGSDLWLADKYLKLHDDFEDNLVLAACERAHTDFLVTTNKTLLQHATVAAKTPAQMTEILEVRV